MSGQRSERARHAATCRTIVKGACCICGAPTRGTRKRRYCSPLCRDHAYRGRVRALRLAPTPESAASLLEALSLAWPDVVSSHFGRMMAERPRPVFKLRCLQCDAPFEGFTRQKYCSRRCRNAAGYVTLKAHREWERELGLPPAHELVAGMVAQARATLAAQRERQRDRMRQYRARKRAEEAALDAAQDAAARRGTMEALSGFLARRRDSPEVSAPIPPTFVLHPN